MYDTKAVPSSIGVTFLRSRSRKLTFSRPVDVCSSITILSMVSIFMPTIMDVLQLSEAPSVPNRSILAPIAGRSSQPTNHVTTSTFSLDF